MKLGEDLNGYRIVSKPTNDGAGKCLWAFADKNGDEYFVKQFLDPKRPRPESMGDADSKRQRLARCAEFERRHRAVTDRLDPADLDAGNLVTAVDFFSNGTHYYKITRRIHPVNLDPTALSPRRKSVLLGTLLDSLVMLHRLDIVHSDLKPQNILLHQPAASDLLTAKLIDFDDAYVSGRPPGRGEIGGDAMYAAPEWNRYVNGDLATGPTWMTTAADLFALGLVVHLYLTGSLPAFDPVHASPAEAVNAKGRPTLDSQLQAPVAALLKRSLSVDPAERPAASEMLRVLAHERLLEPADPVRSHSSRVRTRFPTSVPSKRLADRPGEIRTDPPAAAATMPTDGDAPSLARRPSRVRINLDGRAPADRRTGS